MADDFGDIVFLEEADGGDAGGSGFEAGGCVFERDASEREHRDFVLARLAKGGEPGSLRAGDGSFFEDRGKECQVGSRDCGLFNL